jgi:hypothetical protein
MHYFQHTYLLVEIYIGLVNFMSTLYDSEIHLNFNLLVKECIFYIMSILQLVEILHVIFWNR